MDTRDRIARVEERDHGTGSLFLQQRGGGGNACGQGTRYIKLPRRSSLNDSIRLCVVSCS